MLERISVEVQKQVFKRVVEVMAQAWPSVDKRGHSFHPELLQAFALQHFTDSMPICFMRPEQAQAALEGQSLGLGAKVAFARSFPCAHCGERVSLVSEDGISFEIEEDPCAHAGGVDFEWELNVPSGYMAVANNLRGLYPFDEPSKWTKDGSIGQLKTALFYASQGLSTCYSGDGSLDLVKLEEGNLQLWSTFDENQLPGVPVAQIGLDLWAFSIADYEDVERRINLLSWSSVEEIVRVEVRPGVYRFRHFPSARGTGEPMTYIEWVREPEDTSHMFEELRQHAPSPAQVAYQCGRERFLQAKKSWKLKKDWEDLSEKDREFYVQSGLTDVLKNPYHPGWIRGYPAVRIEEWAKLAAAAGDPLKSFDLRHSLDLHSVGRNQAFDAMDDAFALAYLRLCQAGVGATEASRATDDESQARNLSHTRYLLVQSGEQYLAMRKLRPHLVADSKFDAWIHEVDLKAHAEGIVTVRERP